MIRKTTITDIFAEEGKQPQVTEITNYDRHLPEGFKKVAELSVPKCGRINFKHQILPHLLPSDTKITKAVTAAVVIATDGNGNLCLRCCELINENAQE